MSADEAKRPAPLTIDTNIKQISSGITPQPLSRSPSPQAPLVDVKNLISKGVSAYTLNENIHNIKSLVFLDKITSVAMSPPVSQTPMI